MAWGAVASAVRRVQSASPRVLPRATTPPIAKHGGGMGSGRMLRAVYDCMHGYAALRRGTRHVLASGLCLQQSKCPLVLSPTLQPAPTW